MKHDPSTEQIKTKLTTPQPRFPVRAHAGVQSVATDSGVKPRQHDCDGDCVGPDNAATNEAMAQTGRAAPRTQPTPGELARIMQRFDLCAVQGAVFG